jgi:hypothetical protein
MVRDVRRHQEHQKRVKKVMDAVAHRRDILADLRAKPYVEPPPAAPKPPPAAPKPPPATPKPPTEWEKVKAPLKTKLPPKKTPKQFKAPELPPEVKKTRRRNAIKRSNNNYVLV